VTMGERGEPGPGRDGQLEDCRTAVGFGARDQEPDLGHADLNRLVGGIQPNLRIVVNHECLLWEIELTRRLSGIALPLL